MVFNAASGNGTGNEVLGARDDDARHHADQDAEKYANSLDSNDFACPVCGAMQVLSSTCRRCRADLSLVMSVYSELAAKRARCLAMLRQRRLMRAMRLAKECLDLSDDESSRRLLATCYLLQGDFAAALHVRKKRDFKS